MKSFQKTMFLLYLFAYLQVTAAFEELPKEENEESHSSKGEMSLKAPSRVSKNLIRKKRLIGIFCPKIPSFSTMIVGVKSVVAVGVAVAASTISVMKAVGVTVASIILPSADRQTDIPTDVALSSSLIIPNEVETMDDVAFDLKTIDLKLNQNYENALTVKQTVTGIEPSAEAQILVRKEGFQCDEETCKEVGDGMHAIGICSPYYCECDKEEAQGMKCDEDGIYDPVYQICDDPRHIKICGF